MVQDIFHLADIVLIYHEYFHNSQVDIIYIYTIIHIIIYYYFFKSIFVAIHDIHNFSVTSCPKEHSFITAQGAAFPARLERNDFHQIVTLAFGSNKVRTIESFGRCLLVYYSVIFTMVLMVDICNGFINQQTEQDISISWGLFVH